MCPGSTAPQRYGESESPTGPSLDFVTTTAALIAANPDLVVECAGHSAVRDHVATILQAGQDVVIASIAALADEPLSDQIIVAERAAKSRIILPNGAIDGLDMLRALVLAGDVDVTYRGVKPPAAWKGSRAADLVNLDKLERAETFFVGPGRDAAIAFPKMQMSWLLWRLPGRGMTTCVWNWPLILMRKAISTVTKSCRLCLAIP